MLFLIEFLIHHYENH